MMRNNARTKTSIGIDIGASKVEWAVLSKEKVETSGKINIKPTITNQSLYALVEDIIENNDAKLVGISVAGFVHKDIVLQIPNLAKIKNLNLKDCSKLPIYIQNDIKCAALAQWWAKRKECKNFVVISAGSGIGGAVVHNSKLILGQKNLAGEFGHMKIPLPKPRGNPMLADWEQLCAGRGIEKQFQSIIRGRGSISSKKYKLEGAKEIFESNSPLAKRVCTQGAFYFGMGIANITNALNPEKIIIAGPVGRTYLKKYRKEMEEAFAQAVIEPLKKTPIKLSNFTNPSLIGSILLTRKNTNKKIKQFF